MRAFFPMISRRGIEALRHRGRVRRVTGVYSFSDEVTGGKHTIITDGYGNELRRGNTRSLKLTKGFSVAAAAGNAPSAAARIANERCFMPRSIS